MGHCLSMLRAGVRESPGRCVFLQKSMARGRWLFSPAFRDAASRQEVGSDEGLLKNTSANFATHTDWCGVGNSKPGGRDQVFGAWRGARGSGRGGGNYMVAARVGTWRGARGGREGWGMHRRGQAIFTW